MLATTMVLTQVGSCLAVLWELTHLEISQLSASVATDLQYLDLAVVETTHSNRLAETNSLQSLVLVHRLQRTDRQMQTNGCSAVVDEGHQAAHLFSMGHHASSSKGLLVSWNELRVCHFSEAFRHVLHHLLVTWQNATKLGLFDHRFG